MEPNKSKQKQPPKQVSSGDSKEIGNTGRYETSWEEITEIPIDSIQRFTIIPDYKEKTTARLPIIIQTPKERDCIDGWGYVEQASERGETDIRCHIYHIEQHSDLEIAIRKIESRTKPQGGTCSHAEMVRNTHLLCWHLMELDETLVLFPHGGVRRGKNSSDKNVKLVLGQRLGKNEKTISKHLQHREYLNEAVMEELVAECAKKKFFESIQAQKQHVVDKLKAEKQTEDDIVRQVSSLVSTWLKNQKSIPKIVKLKSSKELSPTQKGDKKSGSIRSLKGKAKQFTQVEGALLQNNSVSSETADKARIPASAESVTAELKKIGETLLEIAGYPEIATQSNSEKVKVLIYQLSELQQQIMYQQDQEARE